MNDETVEPFESSPREEYHVSPRLDVDEVLPVLLATIFVIRSTDELGRFGWRPGGPEETNAKNE